MAAQPQAVTYYKLTDYNSAKCLDVPESSTDGGYHLLLNPNSGKCAAVRQQSQDNNTVVNQYGQFGR
ncbi:hypothetical protein [Streptomyces sp. NPDC050548]|uniref:hypothetical protein n=1 Tax=Streptomyces sp. NPDC050548 TaxID=3365629 RepID=UPI0037895F9B